MSGRMKKGRSRELKKVRRRPLHAGLPSSQFPERLLLVALRKRWIVFLRQLGRCRRNPSEPAIHDLRVATRRLMAAVDLLMVLSSSEELRKSRQQLRRLLKSMGPLRDTQVQLISVRRLLQECPELRPFLTVLLLREQRDLKRISRQLVKIQPRTLYQPIAGGVSNLGGSIRRPVLKAATRLALQGAHALSFARVAEMLRQTRTSDSGTVHRARVAFKKFRYTTEVLRPDIESRLHKAMDSYQSRMGGIHDIEVLLASMSAFVLARENVPGNPRGVHPPKPPAGTLQRVLQHLRQQHAMLVRKFMLTHNEFYGFSIERPLKG